MADKFDPYREALVMETITVWPNGQDQIGQAERQRIAEYLHAHPDQAAELEYIRTHTGFCRKITVTESDLQRGKK
jgi:hypothetical protein